MIFLCQSCFICFSHFPALNHFFGLFLKNNFRFTTKRKGCQRDFLHALLAPHRHVFPVTNITHQCGTVVTIDQPTLTHAYHTKKIVYVKLLYILLVSDLYYFPSLLRTSFDMSCKTALLAKNSLHFCVSEKVFISLSLLKDNFAVYRILGWGFFSVNTLNILLHSSDCLVSEEKSDVILIFVNLQVRL